MIEFYRVAKEYQGRRVLKDVTFQAKKGEFLFLTGPSGAGKTTLLRMIFRAEAPTEGQIIVNGMNVSGMPPVARPRAEALDGRSSSRTTSSSRGGPSSRTSRTSSSSSACPRPSAGAARTRRSASSSSITACPRCPEELSGGEQQRVALARALVNDPVLLVADEPTGNLDHRLAQEVMKLFVEISLRGTTVLVATHDQDLIRATGRRCLTLDAGRVVDGLVEGALPPQASRPARRRRPGEGHRRRSARSGARRSRASCAPAA